jgi:hypothetical protein
MLYSVSIYLLNNPINVFFLKYFQPQFSHGDAERISSNRRSGDDIYFLFLISAMS